MTARTITVAIPELLYLQLEAAARSSAQTVDTVVAQSLERTIPQHLEGLLPPTLRAELAAMEQLSDEALRAIAYSVAPPERDRQMDALIALKQDGTVTPGEQERLTALRDEAEALMVRKRTPSSYSRVVDTRCQRSSSCRFPANEPPVYLGSACSPNPH